jgi:hypothetical protein
LYFLILYLSPPALSAEEKDLETADASDAAAVTDTFRFTCNRIESGPKVSKPKVCKARESLITRSISTAGKIVIKEAPITNNYWSVAALGFSLSVGSSWSQASKGTT